MMKWYYFYTPDYAFWHHHIQDGLSEHFDLHPILVDTSDLSINEGSGHHFQGCAIKLELLVDCISENLGESVLFSDCTLFINKAKAGSLAAYIDSLSGRYDLVFADNGMNRKVNIGITMIRCNRKSLGFWKKLLSSFGEDSWDQHLVNLALGTHRRFRFLTHPGVKWSTFDRSRIVCGYEFNEAYRDGFYLYKQFIYPDSKMSNWNQRLRSLNSFGFLSDDELDVNLKEGV